ncbi:AAA family ATPase [Candidatus Phytoplasma pruni]|uniref:AAA family ATPase n=1 Tax=Candidatus Phytoplasma pruni TaxID=479893 RepID=A0A851H989_9MOLU|nr:AAA family ATPase [Candidatus Phytoplasma pruni]NWN45492.1 AAA family ATPase [Candidatus Phytoplasma pruni]
MISKIKSHFRIFILLIMLIFFTPFLYALDKEEYKVVRNSDNKVIYYDKILEQLHKIKPNTAFHLNNPSDNKIYYNSQSEVDNQVVFDKWIENDNKNLSTPIYLLVYFDGGTRNNDINTYEQLINQSSGVKKIYLFEGQKGGGDTITNINKQQLQQKTKITFDDVAGLDNPKDSLKEIAMYFKDKNLYKKYKAKAPKGVLLYGPPGTGKTILMQALANEAEVPYIIADGPNFIKSSVGAGQELLKKTFQEANDKANSSGKGCIIIIDEIDTIATKRTSDTQASGLDHNTMVNTLLTLLDGIESNEDVVVIGATNKDDLLDEALTRAGRLDRKIYVGLPNQADKILLFKHFLKELQKDNKLEEEVNYVNLADKANDFSGATIKTVVNETKINVIQKKNKQYLVNFIQTKYDLLSSEQKNSLIFGRIDQNADFNNDQKMSNYSFTDLEKIANQMKKFLFPNEKDYYVDYISTYQGRIDPQEYNKVLHGNVTSRDLEEKVTLQNKSREDLEKVFYKLKEYLIDKDFKITEQDIMESIDQNLFGKKDLQRTYSEEEQQMVAANEAGHVLLQYLQQPNHFYKHSVALFNNPAAHNYAEKFVNVKTRKQLLEKVKFLLAGRAAEEVLIGSVSTKSQKDLEEAKKVIEETVYNHGLEDNHYVSYNTFPSKDHVFYENCNKLLNESYNKAKINIQNNFALTKEIQNKLLKDENIDKNTMLELVQKHPLNTNPFAANNKNNSQKNLSLFFWLAIGVGVVSFVLWIAVFIIKKRNRKVV